MSAPRPYVTDPFHPLTSISGNFYIHTTVFQLFFPCGIFERFMVRCRFLNCARILVGRLRTIAKVLFCSLWYVLYKIDGTHAHLLNKGFRPLPRAALPKFSYLLSFVLCFSVFFFFFLFVFKANISFCKFQVLLLYDTWQVRTFVNTLWTIL